MAGLVCLGGFENVRKEFEWQVRRAARERKRRAAQTDRPVEEAEQLSAAHCARCARRSCRGPPTCSGRLPAILWPCGQLFGVAQLLLMSGAARLAPELSRRGAAAGRHFAPWQGHLLELDETKYEWGTLYELECETVCTLCMLRTLCMSCTTVCCACHAAPCLLGVLLPGCAVQRCAALLGNGSHAAVVRARL